MRRWFFASVVCLIVALGLFFALRPRAIAVESALVTRGPIAQTIDVEAKTRVRERYVVAALVAGRVSRLSALEGDRVKAGAVVAIIDPLPSNAAVSQALAQLRELEEQKAGVETLRPKPEAIAQAQSRLSSARAAYTAAIDRRASAAASYQQARRDAQRAASLERSGFLPRSQLESAQLNETARRKELALAESGITSAQADVETARAVLEEVRAKRLDPDYLKRVYEARMAGIRAELRRLEDQTSRTVVRAPASGSVLRVFQKSEQFVAAGTPLLEIGDPRNLEIVADVLSSDAVLMHRGDAMTLVRGAGERTLRARVRLVEPAGYTKVSALGVEEQRVNVIGDFVDPPAGVGDQYRLDVQITTWRTNDALRVPLSALFRCGNSWCTYTVDANRAKRVSVRTGHQSDTDAEVLAGLRQGQRVIVHPSDRIDDGVRIRT